MACRKNGLTFDMETIYKTAIYGMSKERLNIWYGNYIQNSHLWLVWA